MADTKVSALTAASALAGADLVMVAQGGTSKKATCTQVQTFAVSGLAAVATSGSATDLSAGAVPAARMPALTGDITTSAGAVATTIAAGAVTLAKQANLAANSIQGNNTGSPATPIALTVAQTKSLLAIASSDVSGLATSATTDTTNAANISSGVLPSARLGVVIAPTDSTAQNNYNPTNLATARTVNWTGTATTVITGLASQGAGVRRTIRNATTDYLLILPGKNTLSTSGNRWNTPKGLPVFLMPGDAITFEDNGTTGWDVTDWPNQGPAMGLTVFDDFVSGLGQFLNNNTGTGATAANSTLGVDTTSKFVGSLGFATGTTTTGRATVGTTGAAAIVPTLGPALCVQRALVQTDVDGTDTYSFNVGLVDGTTITDGVSYEYRWNGSAKEWSCTRWAAASATRTVSGLTANNAAAWLIIFMNANWTRADYIYSTDGITFTIDASPTTGLPSNAQFAGYGASVLKSAGTTSRTVLVDFLGYRVDQVRG